METRNLHEGIYIPTPSSTTHEGEKTKQAAETGDSADTEQAYLALQNISYDVRYRSGPWWKGACFRQEHVKHVLHDVNLAIPVGQLTGVMGSSGSGKTSLLDVIAYRTEGHVMGAMMYNGRPCTKRMMRQRVSYVIQADRLLPNLTVRETLTYTAYLKLPSSFSKRQVENKVNSVINRMGLRGVADSRVGGAVVRGVSGGEKRRVTIALQLLKDPDILLLDEPTTGLDSFTARHLVTSLQQLAHQGKLVVVTLHQPRSDIVRMLDQTVLMCQGHVMFYGATRQMVPYFTGLGYPCPQYANPLDTYVDVVSIDRRNAERQALTSQRVEDLLQSYKTSDLHFHTKEKVAELIKARSPITRREAKIRSPGWFRVFATVVGRMMVNLWRDRMAFINRVITLPIFVPFVLIFLGRLQHNQASIQDRIGILYNSVSVPPYMGIMNNIACFPALRDHFYREGLDGLYAAQTFLLAYTVHIMPTALVSSLLFSSMMYWLCGMYPDLDRFWMHCAVVFLLHMAGEMLTAASMGAFRSTQLANTTTTLIFTGSGLIASGFLRTLQNMQEYMQYVSWASIQKYASEIVVVNEFHQLNLTCEEQLQGLPCIQEGDVFLDANYPGARDHMERNFAIVGGMTVGYLLLANFSFRIFGLRIMQ